MKRALVVWMIAMLIASSMLVSCKGTSKESDAQKENTDENEECVPEDLNDLESDAGDKSSENTWGDFVPYPS